MFFSITDIRSLLKKFIVSYRRNFNIGDIEMRKIIALSLLVSATLVGSSVALADDAAQATGTAATAASASSDTGAAMDKKGSKHHHMKKHHHHHHAQKTADASSPATAAPMAAPADAASQQ